MSKNSRAADTAARHVPSSRIGNANPFLSWKEENLVAPAVQTQSVMAFFLISFFRASPGLTPRLAQQLIEHSRESCEHFNFFYCQVRANMKGSLGKLSSNLKKGSLRKLSSHVQAIENGMRKEVQRVRALGCKDCSPLNPYTRSLLYVHQHALKYKELEDNGITIERATVYKKLNVLESIFIHLLGDSYRYRLGIQGAQTDLFFWCVLQNRHELSRVLWGLVPYPVRASLTATMLLRRMADEYEDIDHRKGGWKILC